MQVTPASGYNGYSGYGYEEYYTFNNSIFGGYLNSQDGYEAGIADGIAYLDDNFGRYQGVINAILHYNTGPNSIWIYKNGMGDDQYLGHIAQKLSTCVTSLYGISNQAWVDALLEGQRIIDNMLARLPSGQSVTFYRSYQEELDAQLRTIRYPPTLTIASPLDPQNESLARGMQNRDTFTFHVIGLSPGARVRLFVQLPNGRLEEPADPPDFADSNGELTWSFSPLCSSSPGKYTVWVTTQSDISAEVFESNRATQEILPNPTCIAYDKNKKTDIILLIDRTGSMGDSGLIGPAKSVAEQFVQLTSPGDMVGVVTFTTSFPSKARVEYDLTPINSGTEKTRVIEAIQGITAGGSTSVGAGLLMAFDQLRSRGRSSAKKAVILLSDALENRPPWVFRHKGEPGVLDQVSNPPPVYAIALGPQTDQELLRLIAETTGGQYYYAPNPLELQTIYQQIRGSIKQQSLISSSLERVLPGQLKELTTWVSSDFLRAIFSVFWSGSRLNLSLKAPDGTIITPEMAGEGSRYQYYQGSTFATFEIYLPQSGAWTLVVEGAEVPRDGEEFAVTVGGDSDIRLNLYFDRSDYQPGQPVKVLATLASTSRPITLALLTLRVRVPLEGQALSTQTLQETPIPVRPLREQVAELQLFDDGQHDDGEAGDGVYAATFNQTANVGSYIFELKAVGLSGLDLFARMTHRALFIAPEREEESPPGSPRIRFTSMELSSVKAVPNPASSRGAVLFQAQGRGIDAIKVVIFDLSGRQVFESGFTRGSQIRWNQVNQVGKPVANGIYLYRIIVRGPQGEIQQSRVRKLVILN